MIIDYVTHRPFPNIEQNLIDIVILSDPKQTAIENYISVILPYFIKH